MTRKPDFLFTVKLTPKRSIIAIVIGTLLATLTQCGVSEKDLLKYYNEIRKYIPWNLSNEILNEIDNQLNQRINNDPELLKQKIQTEVDSAIRNYELEEQKNRVINMKNKNILEEINKDKYDKLQKLIVENAVYYEFADGTMGIRGAWVAPDPREIPLE
jgi:hypothetical protein